MNIEDFKDLKIEIDYEDIVKNACEKVCEEIKNNAKKEFKGSGEYAESWTYGLNKDKNGDVYGVVHNKDHYRLTHLLEKGHLVKNSAGTYGYTAPRPHIKPAFDSYQNIFIKQMNESKLIIKTKE